MNLLIPRFPVKQLPAMIRTALLGAILAGAYGALHDQVSYSISPEYFTKLKFHQFQYANLGFGERVFASEVGFLASWWDGLIGGWFLGRSGLAQTAKSAREYHMVRAFAIVTIGAVFLGTAGGLLGMAVVRGDLSQWQEWQRALGLRDLRGFVTVAYLHTASYLGALLGLIVAVIYVRRNVARVP